MSTIYAYLALMTLVCAPTPTLVAPSVHYLLNHRVVRSVTPRWSGAPPEGLPGGNQPQVDFFLVANAQSIDVALQDAGWLQVSPMPQQTLAQNAPPLSLGQRLSGAFVQQPDVVYLRTHPSGETVDALVLWNMGAPENSRQPHDPLPAWQAEVLQFAQPGVAPTLCYDVVDDAMAVLLAGEARTLPATAAHKPPLQFIEMRHAAAEMRHLLATEAADNSANGNGVGSRAETEARSEDVNGGMNTDGTADAESAMCPPELRMPLPHRPNRPLPSTIFWHDGTTPKRVAITFDACSTFGHGDYNPAVIAVLQALQVPATLFIGGHWAERHPAELQALAANPLFEIGNHSYSHPHMRELTEEGQRQELLWTQEAIFSRTGVLPRFFRPPYGEVDDTLIRSVADAGLITVEYDLPAGDADFHIRDTRLIDWVVGKSTPGSIVIMHMNHPGNKTAEVLPAIITALRARGLELSTIGGMLAEGDP